MALIWFIRKLFRDLHLGGHTIVMVTLVINFFFITYVTTITFYVLKLLLYEYV